MGQTQVHDAVATQAAQRGMARESEEGRSGVVRPLAGIREWLDNKSRVNREIYARFREGLGVRLPGPTRHRDGFAVWAKRLEEGTYAMLFGDEEEHRREITALNNAPNSAESEASPLPERVATWRFMCKFVVMYRLVVLTEAVSNHLSAHVFNDLGRAETPSRKKTTAEPPPLTRLQATECWGGASAAHSLSRTG